MSDKEKVPTKVFISYSWDSEEHKNRVSRIANSLRKPWGIETDIDQYVRARPPFTPERGWDLWMEKRIEWAEFVLIVCTETYKRRFRGDEEPGVGRGSTWEGTIIRQHLYNDKLNDTKFIPVVFALQDLVHIPLILNARDRYIFSDDESFRTLVYRLRKEPIVVMPEVATGDLPLPSQPEFFSYQKASIDPPPVSLDITQIEPSGIAQEEVKQRDFQDRESFVSEESASNSTVKIDLPLTPRKEVKECDSAKILFIKNVKDPSGRWAYSLDRMEQPEGRVFELMWRASSHGVELPKAKDLMILHQQAKVTHVVEFLNDQTRQTDSGFFRWIRAVWMSGQDWSQLPHQKDVLGFSPNYSDGNTHSLNSPNFSTFRAAWGSVGDFQRHIFRYLTQAEASSFPLYRNESSNVGIGGELIQAEIPIIAKRQAEQRQAKLDEGIGHLVDSLQDVLDPQLRLALSWLSNSKERASTFGKAALEKHPKVQAELSKDFKKKRRFEKELETCMYRLYFALFTANFVTINEAQITFDSRACFKTLWND